MRLPLRCHLAGLRWVPGVETWKLPKLWRPELYPLSHLSSPCFNNLPAVAVQSPILYLTRLSRKMTVSKELVLALSGLLSRWSPAVMLEPKLNSPPPALATRLAGERKV